MHNWVECKVKYDKTMENGIIKKVPELYLVDALSFTEAEARIIEEITPFLNPGGELLVSAIKIADYSEIFTCDSEAANKWFKTKLNFITIDEKTQKERKTTTTMLVQASDLRDAVKRLDEGMKGTMADYEIASVSDTSIIDVFQFEAEKNDKPEFEQ